MGVKSTTAVHEAPVAIDPAQVLLAGGTVNAALFEATDVMMSGELPQFVTWTVCDAVVWGSRAPNESPAALDPATQMVPVEADGSMSET